jgi:hypothetical protein
MGGIEIGDFGLYRRGDTLDYVEDTAAMLPAVSSWSIPPRPHRSGTVNRTRSNAHHFHGL